MYPSGKKNGDLLASQAALSNVNKAASTFRGTAAGVKLGKSLFSPGGPNLNPSQIASLLRAAGVDVPPSVQVTADVAQIVVSGGAFLSSVEAGAKISAIAAPAASVMGAALDLMEVTGLLDPRSPGAQIAKIGIDTALVVATGGLNVLADIALVVDLIGAIFTDTRPQAMAQAKAAAYRDADQWWRKTISTEAQAAAASFTDYHSGKKSLFQYIGAIAESSPELFYNYFPKFSAFIPPVFVQKTFTESREGKQGLFNSKQTYSVTLAYETILLNRAQLQDAFIQHFVDEPMRPYRGIQSVLNSPSMLRQFGYPAGCEKLGVRPTPSGPIPRLSLVDYCILSLLPPYFEEIRPDYDIRRSLLSASLTPADFGISVFEDQFAEHYRSDKGKLNPQPALTINGVDYFTPSQVKTRDEVYANDLELQTYQDMDLRGDIRGLLSKKAPSQMIAEMGVMPEPPPGTWGNLSAVFNPTLNAPPPPPGQVRISAHPADVMVDFSTYVKWRNIRNLWSLIGLVDSFKKDPFFQATSVRISSVHGQSRMGDVPTVEQLEARHRQLQWLAVARGMNDQARRNVASFFGAPVDKVRIVPGAPGQLARAVVT